MTPALQWGGRFAAAPNEVLLQFGSSLESDLVLATFDVRCSLAHVTALKNGNVISADDAERLTEALQTVAQEIAAGTFAPYACAMRAEDIHGAIDQRVRELAPGAGEMLHAGRSRNDQVATTLLLYCGDRAERAKTLVLDIASTLLQRAREELDARTILDACTHWQPAQPVLLAFWLAAAAEPFVRDAQRFQTAHAEALAFCPLGSGAVAGSTLPLDRFASCRQLGFTAPSRNAMDAIGNRDAALDLAHAFVRALLNASRICEELVIWCAPAFGYARLDDGASTGSSLMPQKRNPDPFELVRGHAADMTGRFAGALAGVKGLALSYHRDMQVTKSQVIAIVETTLSALAAFANALGHLEFRRDTMTARAGKEYTVATDVADGLIKNGMSARTAHATVGEQILARENAGEALDWPGAGESIELKTTFGSTNPVHVSAALNQLQEAIQTLRT